MDIDGIREDGTRVPLFRNGIGRFKEKLCLEVFVGLLIGLLAGAITNREVDGILQGKCSWDSWCFPGSNAFGTWGAN